MEIVTRQGIDPELAGRVVPLSSGSASVALELADPDASEERDTFVQEAAEALQAKDSSGALALAAGCGTDKPALRAHLEALAAHFALRARRAALNDDVHAKTLADRHQVVLRALRELERNASPALLVENMMLRLRAETG